MTLKICLFRQNLKSLKMYRHINLYASPFTYMRVAGYVTLFRWKIQDFKETIRSSKTKNTIELYPFLGTPIHLASFLFEKTDIIPNGIRKQKLDNSNIGLIYKTYPDDYNIEEDYEGKYRRYIFNQKNSKSSKDQIDVELEIHTTCLDDSCWFEYHILEFERGMDSGWLIVSHKIGDKCYEDRGGGSPPCL